jgi:hypothetical protein
MKRDIPYTDEHGVAWITAARVAEIWNKIALEKYGVEANYTRWSVYKRREQLPFIDTPLGRLFREDAIATIPLRPRTTTREDTADRNVKRTRKKSGVDSDPSILMLIGDELQEVA